MSIYFPTTTMETSFSLLVGNEYIATTSLQLLGMMYINCFWFASIFRWMRPLICSMNFSCFTRLLPQRQKLCMMHVIVLYVFRPKLFQFSLDSRYYLIVTLYAICFCCHFPSLDNSQVSRS